MLATFAVALTSAVTGAAPAQAVGSPSVKIVQTSADIQPSGSTFSYRLTISCSVVDGDCLNNGVVTVPFEGMVVDKHSGSYGSMNSAVSIDWNSQDVVSATTTNSGIVLRLVDIGTETKTFEVDFTIATANGRAHDGYTWDLQPTITGDDISSPIPGNSVTSTVTAERVTPSVYKENPSRSVLHSDYAGREFVWTLGVRCTAPNLGAELPETWVLTDQLPPEVAFVGFAPSSYGAPTGQYDPETHTVTAQMGKYTCKDGADGHNRIGVIVEINEDVPVGTEFTNTAEWDFTWADGDKLPLKDSADVIVIEKQLPTGTVTKRATGDLSWSVGSPGTGPGENFNSSWTITLSQNGLPDLAEWSLHENLPCLVSPRPKNGRFDSLPREQLCTTPAWHLRSLTTGVIDGVQPYVLLVDGSIVDLVPTNAEHSEWSVPEAYVGQVSRLVVPRATGFRGAHTLVLHGYADAALRHGDWLVNRAWADLTAVGEDEPYRQVTSTGSLYINDRVQIGQGKSSNVNVSDELVTFFLNSSVDSGSPLVDDLVIVDELPAGVSSPFVDGQLHTVTIFPHQFSPTSQSIDVATEVESLQDGRTLLRWRVPAEIINAQNTGDRVGDATRTSSQHVRVNIRFTVAFDDIEVHGMQLTNRARVFAGPAENIHNYCIGPNPRGTWVTQDPENLDSDERTSAHCLANANFRIPTDGNRSAMSLTKEVSGESDEGVWHRNPAIGAVPDEGGVADYRLTWRNLSVNADGTPVPAENVVIYDVLPHIGDTGTVPALVDTPRGSEFTPELVSVTPVTAGVTVEYSQAGVPCRPELLPDLTAPDCADDWSTTAPADLSSVTALRFSHPGPIATNDTVQVMFRMQTDELDDNEVAWNTAAAAADVARGGETRAITPIESPRVGLTYAGNHGLSIEKTADVADAEVGDEITYTIDVESTGLFVVRDVVVADVLPDGVEFVAASDGGFEEDGTVTWNAGDMLSGDTRSYTVTVRVQEAAEGVLLVNQARVTGNTPDGEIPGEPTPGTVCEDDPSASCAETQIPGSGFLMINKVLEGVGVEQFGAEDRFEFDVVCELGDDTVYEESVVLEVDGQQAVTSEVLGPIPGGASCTVTETVEGNADSAADPTVVQIPNLPTQGTAVEARTATASLTNYYSAAQVQLTKSLEGHAARIEMVREFEFEFLMTCQIEESDAEGNTVVTDLFSDTWLLRGGETIILGHDDDTPILLPSGARCFGTETDDRGANESSISHDSFENALIVETGNSLELQTLQITAVNVFTCDDGACDQPVDPTEPGNPEEPSGPPSNEAPPSLSNTGADYGALIGLGAGLLLVGVVLVTRRSRKDADLLAP